MVAIVYGVVVCLLILFIKPSFLSTSFFNKEILFGGKFSLICYGLDYTINCVLPTLSPSGISHLLS